MPENTIRGINMSELSHATQQEMKRRNRKSMWKKVKQYRAIYIMIAPVLIYFAVFSFYPLILGVIQSFQKERMLGTPTFIGLENYKTIFNDIIFRRSFVNSVVVGTASLLINLAVALVLTISVNEIRNTLAKSTIQTVTFLPYLFSWTVVGSMWIFVLSHNGLVNTALEALGFEKIGFFTTASMGRPIILFTNAWKQAGYYVVLMLASVVSIDPAIFEAAKIDGATRAKQIRYIIVPQIMPTIKTLLVLGATGVLRNFDQVFIMERPAIKDGIRTLLLYIYEEGIRNMKIGKATAAATVVLVTTFVISTVVRRLARYDQDASY